MRPVDGRVYRVGEIEIDPSRNCLRRDGMELTLRQKSFQVLLYLLEHRDRLVTKEELIEQLWNGMAVTSDAVVQIIVDLRRALGDDSRHPRLIRTIPKAGYHFISPVETVDTAPAHTVHHKEGTEVLAATAGPEARPLAQTDIAAASSAAGRPWRRIVGGVLGLSLILTVTLTIWLARRGDASPTAEVTLPRSPGRKPVAVLYFENQTGDRSLDWLRGGITDMLVTNLSRSKSLSVLSRQQLHLLLERAGRADAQKLRLDEAQGIARRAQAEALVMGSFAHLGEKTRIDVALHDARSGQLMAAESLVADKPEQILTQVDLLSYKLATSLGAGASDAEHEPRLADVMTSDLDAYRYYSVAMEQAQMFQLHEAIALLKKALARDPRFAMAEARIGYIYAVRMFQGKQAWPHLQKAMRLADRLQEKDMLFIRAWSAQARNESAQAVEAYKAIIAQYPLEAEAYQRLGWLLNSQGRVEEALQVLRQGLVTDPEGKDLYNSLGSVYQRLGRFDEARVAYQRYIQLAPNDPNAWDSLAALHQFLGQYDQAFEGYNRALSINPESKVVVIHLGNLYFRQGRYSAALAQYQRFIQLAQDDDQRARGYGYQAWVYFKMGDRERAEAATAKQLGLLKSPTWDLAPLFLKRGAYARMGTLDATQFTKEAFERLNSGGYQRFWFIHRGWVALSQGQAETAVEQFREALRQKNLDWNIDSYEDCLAYAFLNLGRWDEAIAEYERLLRVNPRYPLAQYHLARAYEGKGDRERALASYRNFLQIWKDADPGLPEVTEAKKRLNG